MSGPQVDTTRQPGKRSRSRRGRGRLRTCEQVSVRLPTLRGSRRSPALAWITSPRRLSHKAAAAAPRCWRAAAGNRAPSPVTSARAPARVAASSSSFGYGLRTDPDGSLAATAPRQFGRRFECRFRTAEMVDKFTKRNRPDVFRSDEAQAGEPSPVIEHRDRQGRRHERQLRFTLSHRFSAPRP